MLAATRVPESRALTGIRGVAALWVVIFHLPNPLAYDAYGGLFTRGYLGVDLFFILSGFVLAYVYRDVLPARPTWDDSRRFYAVRLARIYPLHVAVLAVYVAIELLKLASGAPAFGPERTPLQLLKQLLLIHAWGFADALAWNRVSWSISAEWLAYLIFPLTFAWVRRLPRAAAVGCIAICFGVLFGLEQRTHSLDVSTTLALVRCLAEFHAGALLAQLMHHGALEALPRRTLELLTWTMVATALLGLALAPSDTPIVMLLAVLVPLLFDPRGSLARLLGAAPVHRAGVISYSIYMLQWLVLTAGDYAFERGVVDSRRALALPMLAALWALSELSFRFVETRARERLRTRALRLRTD